MRGNSHVRFLGEAVAATPRPYPTPTPQFAMPYSVTLHHASAPGPLRHEAETRYRHILESILGGAAGVMAAWQAWQAAEHTFGTLSEETWRTARRWIIAAEQARQAALQGLTNAPDAYFEVQQNP